MQALIFPHTYFEPGQPAGLWPLFPAPVALLPASWRGQEPAWAAQGPARPAWVPPHLEPAAASRLRGLLEGWSTWVRQQIGSGRVEALKSGMDLAPARETHRSLMQELKTLGAGGSENPPSDPQWQALMVLHLAHAQERDLAQSRRVLGGFRDQYQHLSQVWGDEELDGQEDEALLPRELANETPDQETPLTSRVARLRAWCRLAQAVLPDDVALATQEAGEARLLAGLAQGQTEEVAIAVAWSMDLPVLVDLDQAARTQVAQEAQGPAWEKLRQDWRELWRATGSGAADLSAQAADWAGRHAQLLAPWAAPQGKRTLSAHPLPGASPAALLDAALGLGPSGGSCPVLVLA